MVVGVGVFVACGVDDVEERVCAPQEAEDGRGGEAAGFEKYEARAGVFVVEVGC